jgi:hypothetical protein
MGCDDWYASADVHPCSFGPDNAPHTAVIIGDSVALQWFPAAQKIFSTPDWRLVALTKSACPMVDAPIFYARIRRMYTECTQWRDAALRYVAQLHPDVVLLGSTYTYDFSPEQWTTGTASVLKSLSSQAGRIYVLRATPRLPFDARVCLAQRTQMRSLQAGERSCSSPARSARADAVYGWLSAAARGYPNVSLVDLTQTICPHDRCDAERNGIIIYRDTEHLTPQFPESVSGILAAALKLDSTTIGRSANGTPASLPPSVPQSTP